MAGKQTSPPTTKNILILGGSYAGISVAHYTLKHVIPKLPDPQAYQVVLVNPSAEVFARTACPRALIADDLLPQDRLFVSLPKLFETYPKDAFRFVQGAATQVRHAEQVVDARLAGGGAISLAFHALVVATGQVTASPLMGVTRDTGFLKESWGRFREGLGDARKIVIAGGGPAGIETAGELGEYLNGRAGWLRGKVDKPKCEITVVTGQGKILPLLRESIASDAEAMLAKVGVTVFKNVKVKDILPKGAGREDVAAKTTVVLDDGRRLEADLYIPATGMTPNTTFMASELLASDGRVKVQNTLRVDTPSSPRIYAIGDVCTAARPAVHNIFSAVPILCSNMKKDLLLTAGDSPADVTKDREFKEDTRETQLVPIGRGKGVGAMMGFRVPSFLVWAVKGRDYWLWSLGNFWNGNQWAKES
jgi:apoptosis-inducing factor 2